MVSEASLLLDEQIAALKELRDAACWAYMGTAALPALILQTHADIGPLAPHLARLAVEHRAELNALLDRAEHWLGQTKPVTVPLPAVDTEYASACVGAAGLLQQLAILVGIEANSSKDLPTGRRRIGCRTCRAVAHRRHSRLASFRAGR